MKPLLLKLRSFFKTEKLQIKNLMLPILFIPFLIATYLLFSFFSQMGELDFLEERIDNLQQKSYSLKKESSHSQSFSSALKNADHYYIDKHLETLTFLDPEIKSLQAHAFQLEHDDLQKQRLEYLQNNNRLLFAEDGIQRSQNLQEMFERQQRSIEVNEEDLKKLLSLIEGVSIPPYQPKDNKPQLIIQDFDLYKKTISSQDKVYVLNMHLIKREQLTQDSGKQK